MVYHDMYMYRYVHTTRPLRSIVSAAGVSSVVHSWDDCFTGVLSSKSCLETFSAFVRRLGASLSEFC